MNVCFACPNCDCSARLDLSAPTEWQCPACDHRLHVEPPPPALPVCAICGNHELYKRKNFPHWLGMTILVVGCGGFLIAFGYYEKLMAWAFLLGTAVIDSLLFLWVGDAIVCYRCNAHYRGFVAAENHKPFELTTGERYRQERLRRELLKPASSEPPHP